MVSNYIAPRKKNDTPDGENISELKLLGPHYSSEKHDVYVKALSKAVHQDGVANIALSGPYGVGKSSILQGFRKHHPDAILISLSTFGFSKPTELKSPNLSDGSVSPQTNQIQKEIVKQLLYRKPPSELPVSRFKRIQKPDWKQLLTVSVMIGFAATTIVAAIGGLSKMPKVSDSSWWDFGIKFAGVWLLLSLAARFPSQLLQGTVHIDKFTAGPATLTLSGSDKGNGESYFDRYLDEIIYFFEMSTCRIVVFEDIDRFGNSEIFEELRELNTLLNNAEQLRNKRNGSGETEIVFIYAMKDSIFESQAVSDTGKVAKNIQDRAIEEIQRTNRTKFFDVIIPVVPFVTHRSARDVMRQELAGVEPKVSDELIDRVAKYVPDFRLLRSVCNEYTIYTEFILRGNDLKLEPDKLFALMLYKSIHLNDFEKIHLGQSKLDEIYKTSVRALEDRISAINNEYDALEKQQDPNAEVKMRSEAFERMVNWAFEHFELRGASFSVSMGSLTFSREEINTARFWNSLCRQSDDEFITIGSIEDRYGQSMPLEYKKSDIAMFIGRGLVSVPIIQQTKDVIGSKLQELDAARQRYQSARMSDLMSDPFSLVTFEGAGLPFAVYVRKMLGSELAAALIRHSYIDQNFVLYTSTYHVTSLSANAMTFRLQHMEQNEMNVNYLLSAEDVRQLLSDTAIEPEEFARPGAYNVAILNYLLLNKDKYRGHFEAVIASMLKDSNNADILLQAFFTSDTPSYNQISLIDELTPRCSRIFDVLVGLRGVPDDQQVGYVDIALRSASSDTDYGTSLLKEFVEQHYEVMATFTEPITEKTVDTLATLMVQAAVKFTDISKIDSSLREHLIENRCYEVNCHNLKAVSDGNRPTLDVLCVEKETVYIYLLQSLEEYLAVIANDESSELSALAGTGATAKVIADVVKLDVAASTRPEDSAADDIKSGDSEAFSLLSNLLGSSGDVWFIDLDSLPSGCWPVLAKHHRLAVTALNIWRYVSERGIDDALVELLGSYSAIESRGDALGNGEYVELAKAILNLQDEQIPVERRVSLVASLGGGLIPAEQINPQEGEFVGRLIAAGLIADDSVSYELAKGLEWPSREFAIASSQRFADYMEVNLVGDDALAIVQSRLVPVKVKQNIINSISPYCYGMDVEDLASLVECVASQPDLTVDGNALIWLLNQGVKSNVVVSLLVTGLDSLSGSDVRDIVTALGQPYSDLLNKGRTQVRVDIIEGVDRLLERLKIVGEVTKYVKDGDRSQYIIHRHR